MDTANYYPESSDDRPVQHQAPVHYQSGQYPPAVYIQADNANNSSLAPVASVIAGSVGVLMAWIPFVGVIAWVLGPLAIIFGALGLKRGLSEHKILSILGMIGGGIALIICMVYVIMAASLTMSLS